MKTGEGRNRLAFTAAVVHAMALAAWALAMPRGFPVSHPRFWANEALPAVAIASLLAGAFLIVRGRAAASRAVLAGVGGAWLGASAAAKLIFPVSAGWLAIASAMLALAAVATNRGRWAWLAAVLSAAVGAAVPWCERAVDPDTRPLNQQAPPGTEPGIAVQVTCGKLQLRVDPMLRFDSTSPDRSWTIFTPFAEGPEVHGALSIERDGGTTQLAAYSTLDRDVYSHLNHFAEVEVRGHSDLRVGFASGFTMPIEPSDYPVGRPTRFAYLGGDEQLHVVEASSAEKGPFHELAVSPLEGGVLTLTLYDGVEPQCRIAFETWAAQAGRALSPTAGWGVPENAVELLRGEAKTAPAAIIVSLAATSVGRGWDTVGHRAGTYVNRMRIEPPEQR